MYITEKKRKYSKAKVQKEFFFFLQKEFVNTLNAIIQR